MAERTEQLDFYVANLDCEHDAAVLTRGMTGMDGLINLHVYPKSAKVKIAYDPAAVTPSAVRERLDASGFPVRERGEDSGPPKPWRNPKVLTSLASGLLLLLGWLLGLAGAPAWIPTAFYAAAILIGGYYFGREAIEALIFEHTIGIELLMSIAAVAAALMGQVAEGAMLVFLYSISEAAEGYTEEKTRSAVKALMDLTPATALVRRDGREFEIPAEELEVEDLFIVKPGDSFATDGEVVIGHSSVNQAPVTGESVPVEKGPGDIVFAGSINGPGALEVCASKTFADNTISRIVEMVEEAQERKGKRQRFVERFGSIYSPAVLVAGILIALIPPLFFGADWMEWATRAVVFIVAAAPCALVISIPITLVASLGTGARHGVLIKGGMYLEELAKVKVMAMDKTGTLTRGEPEVTDVILLPDGAHASDGTQDELLALAAGIELRSEHPLAQAIIQYAEAKQVTPVAFQEFQSLAGSGVSAQVDGRSVYVGSPALFAQIGLPLTSAERTIEKLQGEGKTVVLVGDETGAYGLIAIRDQIRSNAAQAIDALHHEGIKNVVMLTGDNARTAQAVAAEVHIDEYYADLKPADKVEKVRELAERYDHVAMVGDGVNDAPALAEATVGIAMGAAGTDVALETADVALMGDNLESLAYAVNLSHRNQSVVNQNLVLSTIVISLLVIGAVTGVLGLPAVVVGHELSEFLVIGSGLRMLRG